MVIVSICFLIMLFDVLAYAYIQSHFFRITINDKKSPEIVTTVNNTLYWIIIYVHPVLAVISFVSTL